jgi:hypothetical protein
MRNKTRWLIAMTIGLLVGAGAVQADPIFINTCPAIITSPGRYLLGADLTCGGGDGITITSPDVIPAFEGHTITAGVSATNAIVAIASPFLENIHILGPGLITNGGGNAFFVNGVRLDVVHNSEVSGITVRGSAGAGIRCQFCDFVTITANTLGRNGTGIALAESTSNTISDNDASGNGTGIGIQVGAPFTAGTVSHNVLNGNTGAGVAFFPDTAGATVQNNIINGNKLPPLRRPRDQHNRKS